MGREDMINMDAFKVVTKAIAESDNLEIMANHLIQLLVAVLEIKGGTIFILNTDTAELEVLASFGLSVHYMSKGPIRADKSIGCSLKGEIAIINDVTKDDRLQYPEAAAEEGIGGIVSVPLIFMGDVIGVLRLYSGEKWDISEKDTDTLFVLSEIIGLALRYTSLLNAAQACNEILNKLPVKLD